MPKLNEAIPSLNQAVEALRTNPQMLEQGFVTVRQGSFMMVVSNDPDVTGRLAWATSGLQVNQSLVMGAQPGQPAPAPAPKAARARGKKKGRRR